MAASAIDMPTRAGDGYVNIGGDGNTIGEAERVESW